MLEALRHLQFVEMDLESAAFESQEETTRKLLKAVEEFSTYFERNGGFIPNHGERYRNGERISTGFVESAINQVVSKRMAKKQQMQWTQRGAHLLLQVLTRVLNVEMGGRIPRLVSRFSSTTIDESCRVAKRRRPSVPANSSTRAWSSGVSVQLPFLLLPSFPTSRWSGKRGQPTSMSGKLLPKWRLVTRLLGLGLQPLSVTETSRRQPPREGALRLSCGQRDFCAPPTRIDNGGTIVRTLCEALAQNERARTQLLELSLSRLRFEVLLHHVERWMGLAIMGMQSQRAEYRLGVLGMPNPASFCVAAVLISSSIFSRPTAMGGGPSKAAMQA